MYIKNGFVTALIFSLMACGFHLRGQNSYPVWLKNVQINTAQHSILLKQKLTLAFESQNIKIVDSSETKFNINNFKFLESINAGNSLVTIILTLNVSYSVIHNKKIILSNSISRQLNFEYPKNNLLVGTNLKNQTKDRLLTQISQTILAQISRTHAN